MRNLICLLALIFLGNLSAYDGLVVTKLPEEITPGGRNCLNIAGDVVGSVRYGEDRSTFFKGLVAAHWNIKKGFTVIKEFPGASIASSINDNGMACLQYYEDSMGYVCQTLLWDVHSGNSLFGPFGKPSTISNSGDVTISSNSSYDSIVRTWNYIDNTLKDQELYKPYTNKNNNSVKYDNSGNLVFIKNNITYPIVFQKSIAPGNTANFFLNNKDEVYILVYTDNSKMDFCIAKWKLGCKVSYSSKFSENPIFKSYKGFTITAINENAEFLISLGKNYHFLVKVKSWDTTD